MVVEEHFYFSKQFSSPYRGYGAPKQLLIYYQKAYTENNCYEATEDSTHCSWEPHPEGFYKVNWNAAINKELVRVGRGNFIRDYEGKVVAIKCMQREMFLDPFATES